MSLIHFDPALSQALFWLLVAVAADTAVGIVLSLAKGKFHLALVGNFLQTAVLPYIGAAVGLAILSVGWPAAVPFAVAAIYAAIAKFVGDIATKLGIPLGFIKLPPSMSTGALDGALDKAVAEAVKPASPPVPPAPSTPPEQG